MPGLIFYYRNIPRRRLLPTFLLEFKLRLIFEKEIIMGQKADKPRKEFRRKGGPKEDSFDGADDLSAVELLKRIQRQMTFLERKVDHLTSLLENKSGQESHSSKFSGEKKRAYPGAKERTYPGAKERAYPGAKERKFSRSFSKDDDRRPGGQSGEKESSFGKPFVKRGVSKKKGFAVKKSVGKRR